MAHPNAAGIAEASAALIVATVAGAGFVAVPHLVSGWAFFIPGTTDSAMAPTFFPRVALALTVAAGVLVALTTSLRSDPLPLLGMTRIHWLRIGALLAISIAYLLALRLLGFVLSSIILMLALPLLVGYRKTVPLVVTALALPPAVSLVFWYGLKVALPTVQVTDILARLR
jgi:Tripartite tricarboxylate transporter TctB family